MAMKHEKIRKPRRCPKVLKLGQIKEGYSS
jgi:hypothetical protein